MSFSITPNSKLGIGYLLNVTFSNGDRITIPCRNRASAEHDMRALKEKDYRPIRYATVKLLSTWS